MKQTANLKGTFRTLDQFDGDIMDGKGYDGINKETRCLLKTEYLPVTDGLSSTILEDFF